MDDIIETREVDGLTVNVRYDHGPTIGPREWDNLGTFFIASTRHQSPDPMPGSDHIDSEIIAKRSDNICLPVWFYSHSGTCYTAAEKNPFMCRFDSGLAGFIYVTRADVRKEYGVARVTAAILNKVLATLRQEVKIYSEWADGQVFGFEVLDTDGEQIDSCWGFIGEPDHAMQEGIESAARMAKVLTGVIQTPQMIAERNTQSEVTT